MVALDDRMQTCHDTWVRFFDMMDGISQMYVEFASDMREQLIEPLNTFYTISTTQVHIDGSSMRLCRAYCLLAVRHVRVPLC
jgi:hypothetical protein